MSIYEMIISGILLTALWFLIDRFGRNNVARVYEISKILVQSFEQIGDIQGYTAEIKKTKVMKELKRMFPKLHEKDLEKFLEAAVFEMNRNKELIENTLYVKE